MYENHPNQVKWLFPRLMNYISTALVNGKFIYLHSNGVVL